MRLITEEFKKLCEDVTSGKILQVRLREKGIVAEEVKFLADALKSDTSYVTELDLYWNSVRDEGAEAIANVLQCNTTALHKVDLSNNKIGDKGAKALSKALEVNTVIAEIDLSYNSIGDEGVAALANALQSSTTVVKKLNLSNNKKIGYKGAEALSKALELNTVVTDIILWRNSIGHEGATAIANVLQSNTTTVQKLHLGCNKIDVKGAEALGKALQFNAVVADMNLSFNSIGNEGAVAIANALQSKTTAVKKLHLGYNKIGVQGTEALGKALEFNTVIEDINLSGNDSIGDEGLAALVTNALQSKTTAVKKLNLAYNKIGVKGAEALSKALEFNAMVAEIILSGNSIGYKGAAAIANALQSSTTVVYKLDLLRNNIGDKGAEALSKALEFNTVITEMNLSENSIGYNGVTAIANALQSNTTTVQKLDLSNNKIGMKGAEALSNILEYNEVITEISLYGNDIGDEGAVALAKALQTSTTAVHKLNLGNNKIGVQGAEAIIKLLEMNTLITEIYLPRNSMGDVNKKIIEILLQMNKKTRENKLETEMKVGSQERCAKHIMSKMFIDKCNSNNENIDQEENKKMNAVWNWTDFSLKLLQKESSGVDLYKLYIALNHELKSSDKSSQKALKDMIESDRREVDGVVQTSFHTIVDKQHDPIVIKFIQMFGDDLKINLDALKDGSGRSVRDIAKSNKNRDIIHEANTWGRYLGRYKIDGSSSGGIQSADPVHASETCSVFFATDELVEDKNSDKYHVALKLVKVKDHFIRELQVRLLNGSTTEFASGEDIDGRQNRFHDDHVIPLFRYHEGKDVLDEESNQCYCLAMKKGTKSLHHIIDSERIAGRDVSKIKFYGEDLAKAIRHIHNNGFIHGDVKPRNLIRASDGDIKMIDLDATVAIEEALSGKKMSTAYISPEVARIEFCPTESVEDLDAQLIEAEERLFKEINQRYKEFFKKDCDELKAKIDLINENKEVSEDVKADVRMDIWGFGLTMYYLCTNKESLFKAKQANDALEDEEQKTRLLNWKGLSEDDVRKILPDCKDYETKDKAIAFLKKCLHENINKRFQSMDDVIEDPFFTGANEVTEVLDRMETLETTLIEGQNQIIGETKQIHKAVLENAQLMIQLENIQNPYIFQILNTETYRAFIEEYQCHVTQNDTINNTANSIRETINRAQALLTFIEDTLHETTEREETTKRCFGKILQKKDIRYIVVQCGLTFKPVIAYKVKDVKYNERLEKAAKACAKVCAVGLKISVLWNTGANITHMFGYPLPKSPEEILKKANDFFKSVNSSSKVADFFNKDDDLDMQELQDFGELLEDLEKENRVRFYLGNEEKDECLGKKWTDALVKSVLKMKGGKRTITYISKDESGRVGYKEFEIDLA